MAAIGERLENQCRICLEVSIDDLIVPCACAGTSKYVHRACLNAWRTTPDRPDAFYACTTCDEKYVMRPIRVFPSSTVERQWRRGVHMHVLFDTLTVFVFAFLIFLTIVMLTRHLDESMALCVTSVDACAHPIPSQTPETCVARCPILRNQLMPETASTIDAYGFVVAVLIFAYPCLAVLGLLVLCAGHYPPPLWVFDWNNMVKCACVGASCACFGVWYFIRWSYVRRMRQLQLNVLTIDDVVDLSAESRGED